MPGDSGVLVVARVRSTTTKCTRGRGCNGHPAFPTPSSGRRILQRLGRSARRDREVVSGIRATSLRAKRSNPFFLLHGQHGLLRFARNDGLERANTLSRRRPRKRAIKYSEAPVMESRIRGVLDTPHARGMTALCEERSERSNPSPSFRGDAKHRTRNLEIPRCAIAHL
jgi:hypothetical protein